MEGPGSKAQRAHPDVATELMLTRHLECGWSHPGHCTIAVDDHVQVLVDLCASAAKTNELRAYKC